MKKLIITALAITVTLTTSAEAKRTKYHRDSRVEPIDKPMYNDYYDDQLRIGNPRVVYHQIGTNGAQNGNTILPCYNKPVRSGRPYEIRYDYGRVR